MSDLRFNPFPVALLTLLALAAVLMLTGQTRSPRQFHVSGVALPVTTPASPTAIEGGALTTDVNVDGMLICNKDTASHTVIIEDCGSPQFILSNSYTIAASTMWPIPGFNSRFRGCFKWASDSALVMGTVVGTR